MKFLEKIIEKHKIRVQNKEQLKRIKTEREKKLLKLIIKKVQLKHGTRKNKKCN